MTSVSLEHRTERWWLFHPLALSSMSTHSTHRKPQRHPDDTEISPAFKVPQGRRADAPIPPGSEILLEVRPSTFVSSREGLWFLTVLSPLSLPASFLGTSLQDPIRPSMSLLDPPFILLFLERFQLSPGGAPSAHSPAPFFPSFPLNKYWGGGRGEGLAVQEAQGQLQAGGSERLHPIISSCG